MTGDPVAVVTGAACGLGQSIVINLARRGYRLAVNDLSLPEVTLEKAQEVGADVIPLVGDGTKEAVVQAMAWTVVNHFRRVDLLVNNAGISALMPAEGTTLAEWSQILAVDLTAPFLMCREFGKEMLLGAGGSIVNVSSVAGLLGFPNCVAYSASEHGLVGLTRTLAVEWGGRGVRVNAVCPSWVKMSIDTENQATGDYTDFGIQGRDPTARFATHAEVANAVAFLADPEQSGHFNGYTLSVDGGWFADDSWERIRNGNQRP